MKLTFDQIKSITVGAVRFVEKDGALGFHKCTEKEVAAWYALSQILGQRSETTTGVHLDFITNSQSLSFTVGGGTKYEVYVDGVVFRKIEAKAGETFTMALTDPLGDPKESYRVEIILPSHGVGSIYSVELDDGAYFRRPEYNFRMMFIGDSITQGHNSKYDSMSFAYRVSRFFNAETVINGIGGARYHESTFDKPDFEPDVLIIAYGTNDYSAYNTVEEIKDHIAKYLALAKEAYKGSRIFAISPIWRKADDKPMGSFAQVRRAIIQQFEESGVEHIDGLYLAPPIEGFYADLHLHPNDEGFSVYAENLIAELIKRGLTR